MKKNIYFFRFRVEDNKFDVTFFDVGAFSTRQAYFMLYLGLRVLKKTVNKEINFWRIPRPEGVVDNKAFVMHEGQILKF